MSVRRVQYLCHRPQTDLIDLWVYLPTSWIDDRERCRRAGIGDEIVFATKGAMAKAMAPETIEDKILSRLVTANAASGYNNGWRFELEQADVYSRSAATRSTTCSPVCRGRSENAVPWRGGPRPADLRLGPYRGTALAPRGPPPLCPECEVPPLCRSG
ncbi:transposase [Streptomyces sp. B3I7]|uniref:transposase n=1 Tax=Streptomyces sp. B3I7 TaxID=3042269 RepID=UPI00359014A3